MLSYTVSMNEKTTDFGLECKKLRLDKGMSMTEASKGLGCSQSSLTYYEQGKTKISLEFLEKCFKIYEVPNNKRADLLIKALSSQEKLTIELDKITMIPKDTLAKFLAVLLYNLHEPPPETEDRKWDSIYKAIEILNPVYKKGQFTVLQ